MHWRQVAQARLLVARRPAGLVFSLVAAVFAAVLAGSALGPALLATWLALLAIAAAVQAGIHRRGARADLDERAWCGTSQCLVACHNAAALAWGLAGWTVCSQAALPLKAWMVLLVTAFVLGELADLSADLRAFTTSLIAALGPVAGGLAFSTDAPERTLGVLVIIIATGTLLCAWRCNRTARRGVALALDNQELVGVVEALQARLDHSEETHTR